MKQGAKFFLLISFTIGSNLASPPDTLRLVSVLYRHGDRSPMEIYPKDINQVNNTWPDGLGWLTNIGKMQQYELGKYIRQRYDGFLNTSHYTHGEIYIEASAENRCLMSAYANLAGLYPPLAAQLWNPDLKWQPIPVQTRPMPMDKLAEGFTCPRYEELFQELLESQAIKEEEEKNKEFYEMVEKNTGIEAESIKDIWSVADALVCEKEHNLTWNDWVYKPGVWDKMNELRTFSFDLLFYTSALTRLKGGPLLKEIITNMQAATKNKKPMPKFFMYSAHDTTVASLLSAMHVFDKHQPIYRALVMVELHEINEKFFVKIFYRNDTTKEPTELAPKGCSGSCTLTEFLEVTKDTVPIDWKKECKAKKPKKGTLLSPASWIALCVSVTLVLAIVAAVIITVVRKRNKDRVAYSQLC